jgi:prolycopene isomerase
MMQAQSEPTQDAYDVVVIGAGLGGLSAAALLAKTGGKVLVAERQDGAGGYAHTFKRDSYLFDPAIHVIGQAEDGRFLDFMFRHLGVRDRVTFLPLNHFYGAHFPGLELHVPIGTEAFIDYHASQFPHQREQIRAFIELCRQVHSEAHYMPPQIPLKDLDQLVERFPVLFSHLRFTLGEVLAEHFIDVHAASAVVASWPYVGSPPSRLSFLTFTQMLFSQIEGTYYSAGSFQRLADALVFSLTQNGGELSLKSTVRKILVQDGKVTGVVLEDGRQVEAACIISNADAKQTFEQLVGEEHLPTPLVRRLRRMQPSLSACVLYAGTTMDLRALGAAHETFFYKYWDHEETYSDIMSGKPGGMWVNVPSIVDPSLAPPNEHVLIFTALAPFDIGRPWEEEKERYTETMIAHLDTIFPGVRQTLTYTELGTPEVLYRYTLNQGGALYGWEYTPDQSGSKRLPHQTPISGLFLSGHWTQPGAASLRVLVSGIHTAQIVMRVCGLGDAAAFRPPDLPPV